MFTRIILSTLSKPLPLMPPTTHNVTVIQSGQNSVVVVVIVVVVAWGDWPTALTSTSHRKSEIRNVC